MQIIRTPADPVSDPELRQLIDRVFATVSECPEILGFILIVEAGDNLATINSQIGFDILANRWTGLCYDQPGYTPAFEILAEHADWYEMVVIISDDGFGLEVFIPKTVVIPDLLAMCQRHAPPAADGVI
ncbi:MAG: hypothetical protein IPN53_05340 [Comamonadaceae bacterium]|nr:hypothetical protein [Comamonadaceae bacterium]